MEAEKKELMLEAIANPERAEITAEEDCIRLKIRDTIDHEFILLVD